MRQSTIILFLGGTLCATGYQFSLPNWLGEFDDNAGVLRSLRSTLDASFDFSPSDVFDQRNGGGNYHTGDLTVRWRYSGDSAWEDVDTATRRSTKPNTLHNSTLHNSTLLHSSYDNVFPEVKDTISLSREWAVVDGDLVLQATIHNTHNHSAVEIGAFGFPIEFNSILTGRDPVDTTNTCVFMDPYIGLDAGYVQVTRLTGTTPNMVVTPYGDTSKFEAWRFLHEETGAPLQYMSQTFEGFYSWQTLSKAYAENEWNATTPWNSPSSVILETGQTITFGLRFSLAPSVEGIEPSVSALGQPVAVGLPGYILSSDIVGKLFLLSKAQVESISTEPPNALRFTQIDATNKTWKAYDLSATHIRERVRVEIAYSDGKTQTVHYYVTDPAKQTFEKHAKFLFSDQWFEGNDVFNRTPSIITYDYEAHEKVQQEARVWIAGLQDEGGAASYVAAAMKTAYNPIPEEVRRLEEMAFDTIWTHMQYTSNNASYPKYSVKRSLFFYDPSKANGFPYNSNISYGGWPSWNKELASQVWRPYNYVWVSTLYWSLYRAEKLIPGTLTNANASWYLETAYHTLETCYSLYLNGDHLVEFRDVGLMGETIWHELLSDLRAEGLTSSYDSVRSIMQTRQQHCASVPDPFGSEAPWDSTGQEAVYLWSQYFNDSTTVDKTLASIRAYMPAIPHWAYNGNVRRWWDFGVAGKLARIERQVHHYASPLNAVPLLDAYTRAANPSFHDLRVGYAGWSGALSNINSDGFGSQAFHAWPESLKWDAYSSDYGAGLTGHMVYSMCTLVDHPDFGFVSMGGNVEQQEGRGLVQVMPRDTVQRRIYVTPIGLHLKAGAGRIESFSYDPVTRTVVVNFGTAQESPLQETHVEWQDMLGLGINLDNADSQGVKVAVSLPGRLEFHVR